MTRNEWFSFIAEGGGPEHILSLCGELENVYESDNFLPYNFEFDYHGKKICLTVGYSSRTEFSITNDDEVITCTMNCESDEIYNSVMNGGRGFSGFDTIDVACCKEGLLVAGKFFINKDLLR